MAIKTDIATVKRVLVASGAVALVSGAFMAFSFGYSMSLAHGITLALLSVVAAVMPTMIDHLRRAGRIPTAATLSLFAVLFVGAEYFSHLGYTIGHRVGDVEQTAVQNTRYDDTREQVADHRANLKMWQAQLTKLQADNAWAPTIKADGLRSELATLKARIEEEKKGNRGRKAGCGKECERLQNEAVALEQRLATVEQATDLSARIEATQRLVDSSREKAAKTERRSSPIVNQTKFVGQLFTVSLEPGKEAMTWTQIGIGALIAMVTTFLAPLCFFMAFGDQPRSSGDATVDERQSAQGQIIHTIERIPGPERVIERSAPSIVQITDAEGRKAMEVLDQALAKWRMKGAAA